MLKWIISQKLLNVQWKVVTETLVSDFSFFSPSAEIRMYRGFTLSVGFIFGWPKLKCFHRTLFKGHWKTQHLQGQLEGLRHREAGSLAEYCSLSLPQCLNDFGTQVIKLGGNRVGCLHNLIPAVWWKNKYMFQVSLWFKLSWFFNSVWIN